MPYGAHPLLELGALLLALAVIVAIAVLVGAVIIWALRHLVGPPPEHDTAMRILRERFARGEITADEFEEMRRRLGG